MHDEDQQSLFLTWLDKHSSSVMKVARAYTLTSEECQELAQEILLEAWRSLPNFEGQASAATWFYRVALHTAMNWHRKDKPRRSRQQPLLEVQTVATDGVDSAEQALSSPFTFTVNGLFSSGFLSFRTSNVATGEQLPKRCILSAMDSVLHELSAVGKRWCKPTSSPFGAGRLVCFRLLSGERQQRQCFQRAGDVE